MHLSNRVLWILILFWFILFFYWFYKYFFQLNLTSIEITSNVSNFSWSLVNNKFSKDFFCKDKKCTLTEIPPFEYDIIITKDYYKDYKTTINLSILNKIDILLEKDILIKDIKNKKISSAEFIQKVKDKNNEKINFTWESINYLKIYWNDDFVYFFKNEKLYFSNLKNNNLFELIFKPEIKYIKNISSNNLLIVSDVGSFVFNLLNKDIEYFSLFKDLVFVKNNYIWVINKDDLIRKKNFGFENISWNLIVSYNLVTKKSYVLRNLSYEIDRIYLTDWKIYIQDNEWKKFEIIWY